MGKHSQKIKIQKKLNIKFIALSLIIISILLTFAGIIKNKNITNEKMQLYNNNYMNKLEEKLLNEDDENVVSNKYLITDNTIERIRENTSIDEFISNLNKKVTIYKINDSSNPITEGIITGNMIAQDEFGTIYSLIINGDVNKDGFVNEIDISKIIRKEMPDQISTKASEVGIDKITDKIVFGRYELEDINEVLIPTIEVESGTLGENNCYTSDVLVKIIQNEQDALKTVYKIKGSKETEISEITESEQIELAEDGVYKIIAYTYGKDGNKSKIASKIIKVNKTGIEASITYSPNTETTQPVIATITFNKEDITITNNDGKDTFEFTENGTFEFEYIDEAGRTGSAIAEVNWIRQEECIGQDGLWKYIRNKDGTIQLTQYLGTGTELIVPAEYDGYTVYSVGSQYAETQTEKRINVFGSLSNTEFTKLTIENGIKEIKLAAFCGCSGFRGNLVIPESVTKIGDLAFESCSGFTGDIIIPNSVTKLGIRVFQRCSGFDGTVIFPENLTEIPNYTCNYCTSLKGPIQLPENITSIGNAAFQNCNQLTGTLNIPETVTYIGSYSFNKCGKLTGDLIIPPNVKTIGRTAFQQCTGFNGILTLPEGLEAIEPYTFYNCNKLTGDLIIPSTVGSLGDYAFYGCNKLTGNLVIPEGVIKIGNASFNGCEGFNGTMTLPNTLTEVGEFAFNGCKNLTGDLIIPDSVITIKDVAFQCLTKMTGRLQISKNIKTIGRFAFYDDKFTGELILPEGLEELGPAAFGKNTNFSNTQVVIPSTLRKIGIDADFNGENIGLSTHDFYNFGANVRNFTEFVVADGNEHFKTIDGVLYTIDEKRMISYPRNKSDETFEIPESVITLDELSISSNCLLDTIIIPDNFVLDPIPNFIRMEGAHVLTAALYSYNEVNNIVAKETNPNYKSVDGVLYSKDLTELVYISSGRTSEVIIPEGVTSIRDRALYYNQVYYIKASKIYIPASLQNITDAQINSLNSISQKIEVSPDNPNFTVNESNKLIRK